MSKFFNYFPSTYYTSGANNVTSLDVVTNIIARFNFESSLKQNSSAFYEYQIKDSDTPEIIAAKFYSDPERHWIVLLFNDIIDPQYGWPLQYSSFIKYVNSKYSINGANNDPVMSGLQWAKLYTHSYYKIVTRTQVSTTINNRVSTETLQIDQTSYTSLLTTTTQYTLSSGTKITENISKQIKTYYDYEEDLNESKRSIKLLKPEFVNDVMREFKDVITQ